MRGSFLFLGTGGSAGVPLIGCYCPVCTSNNPKDRRLRPSGLLSIGGKKILIDVGPDFREQALRYRIDSLDGLILTHTHYDHIAGIDELRIFNVRQKKPFPCLLSKESDQDLKKRYSYLFESKSAEESDAAQIDCNVLDHNEGKTEFLGIPIGYFSFIQGKMRVHGYRFGDFAYITDIRHFDESIFSHLRGVKKLVLSALRATPSRLHLTLDEACGFAKKVGAENTWFTHISHAVDHEAVSKTLPKGIHLGYDGLEIPFEEKFE